MVIITIEIQLQSIIFVNNTSNLNNFILYHFISETYYHLKYIRVRKSKLSDNVELTFVKTMKPISMLYITIYFYLSSLLIFLLFFVLIFSLKFIIVFQVLLKIFTIYFISGKRSTFNKYQHFSKVNPQNCCSLFNKHIVLGYKCTNKNKNILIKNNKIQNLI